MKKLQELRKERKSKRQSYTELRLQHVKSGNDAIFSTALFITVLMAIIARLTIYPVMYVYSLVHIRVHDKLITLYSEKAASRYNGDVNNA